MVAKTERAKSYYGSLTGAVYGAEQDYKYISDYYILKILQQLHSQASPQKRSPPGIDFQLTCIKGENEKTKNKKTKTDFNCTDVKSHAALEISHIKHKKKTGQGRRNCSQQREIC